MSYALRIKNVNFAANAVGHVTYTEPVPCTAISLSAATLSFDTVEEVKTLTATVTPSDTTDTIVWASSNENVATVSNGAVTIHGLGTATITATCGNQTASCSISQTSIKAQYAIKKLENYYPGPISIGNDSIIYIDYVSNQYAVGQAYHNDDKVRVNPGEVRDIECVPVPYGATKIKVATTDGVAVSISYTYVVDTTEQVHDSTANYAKYLRNQTFVNTGTGYAVEYGEAVIFRCASASQADTLDYIYFE